MLTAVFDSSDDEDTYEATISKNSNLEAARQSAAVDGLQAELSDLSLEYEHEGGLAQEVLSCLGLSVQALSTNGQEALTNIAGTAHSLQLRGCEQYMFLTALIQLAEQQHELLCAQDQAQSMQRWLTSHHHAAVQQLQQLQAVLRSAKLQAEVTAGTAEIHQQNIQLLSQKKHQYDQQMSDLHTHLADVGLAPQFRHLALMERQRAYDEQLARVTKKEEKLATFLDLPPDPSAAKKVFEAKMQSLLSARKKLEDGLSFL